MTARFELLRLAAEEVAEGVALVELEGRWDGEPPPARDARLEAGEHPVEPVRAVDGDGRLRATFAVPAGAASGPLALAAGDVRVRLPAPDGDREDRLASLARELNRARHQRDELRKEADELRRERDALREEAEELRARPAPRPPRRAPVPHEPPAPAVVTNETPPPAVFYGLAGLGVVGFLMVLVILL